MTLIRMLSEDKDLEYYRNRCNALEQMINRLGEDDMLFTFLETGTEWHNSTAERTINPKRNHTKNNKLPQNRIWCHIQQDTDEYKGDMYHEGIEFLRLLPGISWQNRFKKIDRRYTKSFSLAAAYDPIVSLRVDCNLPCTRALDRLTRSERKTKYRKDGEWEYSALSGKSPEPSINEKNKRMENNQILSDTANMHEG